MSLHEEFSKFHYANPDVYRLFCVFAQEAIRAGKRRYSAKAIFERIRWHHDIEVRSRDEFLINNNFTPFYARKFMRDHPQHCRFFETRKSEADHFQVERQAELF